VCVSKTIYFNQTNSLQIPRKAESVTTYILIKVTYLDQIQIGNINQMKTIKDNFYLVTINTWDRRKVIILSSFYYTLHLLIFISKMYYLGIWV